MARMPYRGLVGSLLYCSGHAALLSGRVATENIISYPQAPCRACEPSQPSPPHSLQSLL